MKKAKTRIFDELKAGLEDSIAFSQGELSLVTTTMPAPPPKREPTQIADLRHSLRMSQAVFAAVINEDPGVVKIIMTPKPKPTLRSRAGFAGPVR